jgi:O-antigen/teichoic acid export membrane protein
LVYGACQWLVLSALAKLGNRTMVGQFSLGLALTAPVVLLANLSLNTLQVTDARREYAFHEYFGLRLVTTAAALPAIVGIALGGGYHRTTAVVILIVGVSKVIDAVSDVLMGLLQQRERMDLVARTQATTGVSALLATTVLLWATRDIVWCVSGTTLGSLVALAAVALPSAAAVLQASGPDEAARRLLPSLRRERALLLAKQAAPIGVITMLLSLNTTIPRYFLERHAGEGAVGSFSALAAFMVLGTMISNALGQAASPRLAAHHAAGDVRSFCRLLFRMCGVVVGTGVVGVGAAALLGRPLLTLLYRPEYAEHEHVFVWLMAASAFSQMTGVLGVAASAMRLFRPQVPAHCVNTAVSVALFAYLVSRHGLRGAAWATLIASVLLLISYSMITAFGVRRIARGPG